MTFVQRRWLAVANWALRRAGLGRIAALEVVEWDDLSEKMDWCTTTLPDGSVEIDFEKMRR